MPASPLRHRAKLQLDALCVGALVRATRALPAAPVRASQKHTAPTHTRELPSSRGRYSIQQLSLSNQPLEELYCVRATYVPTNRPGIQLFVEARKGSAAGDLVGVPPNGTMDSEFVAFPDNTPQQGDNSTTAASKLRVGLSVFSFLYDLPSGENSTTSQGASTALPANMLASLPPELRALLSALPLSMLPGMLGLAQGLSSKGLDIGDIINAIGDLAGFDDLIGFILVVIPPELVQLIKSFLFKPVCAPRGMMRRSPYSSHLLTHPCPSRPAPSLRRQHWIVHVSEDYDWVIVSGGPPDKPSNGFCTTGGSLGDMNVGTWLMHRNPRPPDETVQTMRGKAAELGFDVSVLAQVNQTGCAYAAAAGP